MRCCTSSPDGERPNEAPSAHEATSRALHRAVASYDECLKQMPGRTWVVRSSERGKATPPAAQQVEKDRRADQQTGGGEEEAVGAPTVDRRRAVARSREDARQVARGRVDTV